MAESGARPQPGTAFALTVGMRIVHALLLPLVVLALLACACAKKETTPQIVAAIEHAVAGKAVSPSTADAWNDVREFYKQRNNAAAWVDDKYTSKRAADALIVLRSATDHGLNPDDYDEAEIVRMHTEIAALPKDAPDRLEKLAAFETRVTSALLSLGRDVALGRTSPNEIWKIKRETPDLAGTLVKAVDGDVKEWLTTVRPPHAEYEALQKAYVDLRGQKEKGGWPAVPAGLKPGKSHAGVVALRQRLAASGELKGDVSSQMYDGEVETAVKAFQDLHSIKATGIVDEATRTAMNVPLDDRLEQVALNLDRWRWMPDDLGDRHFFVNIPYYHLIAREHGKPVMDIRVVVGKPGNETPIFTDEMETVVFSPYWNIPDSIKQGETAPAVMRDPGYLDRNNIEILRGSKRISAASVNWGDPSELRQLAFRQRPGASNALGHVKFLFPNDFDVYLHDTPADSLFQRQGRAFSHGCVRVEEPETLAKYVLQGYSEWDEPKILNAMHSGNEQHVKLKEKIPVHITYFTAWVDEKGGLHFQPDIYGYDARQSGVKAQSAKTTE
jgi:murein L,D-transpeptidase YcbB/YkuD